jgi:hypothetical protein
MDELLNLPATFAILAVCAAALVWLVRYERRPREFGQVRLLPTTPLIFAAVIVIVVMLAHMGSLLHGGAPLPRAPRF